jgi:predicted O-methyltransferase YrrM
MDFNLDDLKRVLTNYNSKNLFFKTLTTAAAKFSSRAPILNRKIYRNSLKSIQKRSEEEDDLDDILDTVLEVEPGKPYEVEAKQLRDEIRGLAKLVKDEEPETIMEIGTLWGGTFYIWNRYIDSAEKIVSLDLPGGSVKNTRDKILNEFNRSKKTEIIRGNSHSQETLKEVKNKVDKVDFLLIDGDHTYEGVKQDFEMYKDLVSSGGIIAFHDIVPHVWTRKEYRNKIKSDDEIENNHVAIGDPDWGVAEFWKEISDEYETEEFIANPNQRGFGIGVIYIE